jgi:DNA-binding SARP family transcriptional activator
MAYLSLSLLGPFQAWTENGQQQTFRTLKERALVAYLAVEHERRHPREELAELFWPERSEGIARNNLRQALFGIRQAVGEAGFDAIFTVTPHEVQANLSQRIWLDVAAFGVHLQAFREHSPDQPEPCGYCLQQLHDAVELYRGYFLEDVVLEKNQEFQHWVLGRRERYLQQQRHAIENLVTLNESLGNYSQAALYLLRLIEMSGLVEDQYRRLMLLLARNGQFNAALEHYEILRRRLAESQGRAPGEETVEIAGQIQVGRFDLSLPRSETRHNLPEQLTPFIGREMELAWLAHALENPLQRLVSVVGPGGVGKTRLAVQAALM